MCIKLIHSVVKGTFLEKGSARHENPLNALTAEALCNCSPQTFLMEKVREMVNTHLPVVLKVINTVAFVAIAASTICAADSLKEMSGKGAAPAAVTETN